MPWWWPLGKVPKIGACDLHERLQAGEAIQLVDVRTKTEFDNGHIADAVHVPTQSLVQSAARHGADVGCCGTCIDARGITDDMLTEGARRSTLDELTDWTLWADKVVTF